VNLTTGLITTVAGNGTQGYGGDNGQATAAALANPTGVAVDTAGDLFISDQGNQRIREVDLSTGVITTAVGNGSGGYRGDNGPAIAAALDGPLGVAVDAAGNLFIADTGNNRIREVTSGATVVTVNADPWTLAGTGAFMGPGTTDMLWFNQTSGVAKLWIMTNGAVSSTPILGSVPSGWKILAIGDFNGDGTSDLLWYNQTSGLVGEWLIQNGAIQSCATLGSVAPGAGWKFLGSGDFNGNGTPDLLWYNPTSGQVGEWLIQNGAVQSFTALGNVAPGSGWNYAGMGDFNGDGTPDLLWYNPTSGQVAAWLIQNGGILGFANIGFVAPNTGWNLAQIADFTNDGTDDLLWQNQLTGQLEEWLIQNAAISGFANIGVVTPNTGWSLAAVVDLNGDGTPDLLWYNQSSGQADEWLMQTGGAAVQSYPYLSVANPSQLQFLGVVNVASAATPYVLWRGVTTGQVSAWVIQNGTIVGQPLLGTE
jgi:hypothetical protein